MENASKTLLKVYFELRTFMGLFCRCVFFQFSTKKYVYGIFAIAYVTEVLHCEIYGKMQQLWQMVPQEMHEHSS